MKKLAIMLMAGTGTLFVGSANASDIYTSSEYTNPVLLAEQVRLVCDDSGRCYKSRSNRRVIVRESYGYAPRERYIERRGYEERGGIGIRAPGVSVGIGTDRY